MPITYSIDPKARLVRLDYSGPATYDEWEAVMLRVLRDAAFEPGFDFLSDRRRAGAPTTDYIRRSTEFLRAHRTDLRGCRWAVVGGGTAGVGMANMGEVLAAGALGRVAAFPDVDAALHWLHNKE